MSAFGTLSRLENLIQGTAAQRGILQVAIVYFKDELLIVIQYHKTNFFDQKCYDNFEADKEVKWRSELDTSIPTFEGYLEELLGSQRHSQSGVYELGTTFSCQKKAMKYS